MQSWGPPAFIFILLLYIPIQLNASLVGFGKDNEIRLGDSASRLKDFFPSATRETDWSDNERRLNIFSLSPPHSIDADKVRFIFENNKLVQIDHLFGDYRVKEQGGWEAYYEALSRLFGTNGITSEKKSLENHIKHIFNWESKTTNESASLRILKNGGIEVLFSGMPPEKFSNAYSKTFNNAIPRNTPANQDSSIATAFESTRPENGTIFLQTARHSGGSLQVKNGTKWDAVVKLVSPHRKYTFVSFYVREGRTATVPQIRANTYKLVFALGEGWDERRGRFHRIFSTSAFESLLTISKNAFDSYNGYSVTLNPVVDGNAATGEISEEEFLSY